MKIYRVSGRTFSAIDSRQAIESRKKEGKPRLTITEIKMRVVRIGWILEIYCYLSTSFHYYDNHNKFSFNYQLLLLYTGHYKQERGRRKKCSITKWSKQYNNFLCRYICVYPFIDRHYVLCCSDALAPAPLYTPTPCLLAREDPYILFYYIYYMKSSCELWRAINTKIVIIFRIFRKQ